MTNSFFLFLFSAILLSTDTSFRNPENRDSFLFQRNRINTDSFEDFDALYESLFKKYGQKVKAYPIALDWSYFYEKLSDSTVRVGRSKRDSITLELSESREGNTISINNLIINCKLEKTLWSGQIIPPQGDNPEAFMVKLNGKGYTVVRFSILGCAGISCARSFFLIVDRSTEDYHFFESLFAFNESLYSFIDFNDDGQLDFVKIQSRNGTGQGYRKFSLRICNLFEKNDTNLYSKSVQENNTGKLTVY
jgi:hypothetical protein